MIVGARSRIADMGVSINSLIYRCREIGLCTDTTAQRAYQRLNQMKPESELIEGFPGEQPSLLRKALELASGYGLTVPDPATELRWPLSRVRHLLGSTDQRPTLNLVPGGRIDSAPARTGAIPSRHLQVVSSDPDTR